MLATGTQAPDFELRRSAAPTCTSGTSAARPCGSRYDLGRSWLAAMKPSAIATLPKARRAGFRSGPVDGPANRVPADYLIDRQGKIAQVYEGRSIADHIPLDTVDSFLAAQGA